MRSSARPLVATGYTLDLGAGLRSSARRRRARAAYTSRWGEAE